ncbi:uroporphyrinogen-III C-methyltransferase [Thermovenabulum gondwanense]|uniref:uroporphyrinogen-III C-methyltransferase n=1 Tax=Thermovenabulum gondwanense TaxID=520767 RepID=A0A162MRK1_9FIRM|nr:uroporphyrinogen-III C-methyltransferase [Thermovenabulum gondwanense]KYO67017.1 Uroporphyrinogen-III C-methyltransferase [Thermovenabulum gondwanense]
MGKVYLIGAGPYDEELLTLKAVRALGKCDVAIYDRLVNKNILNYLKEGCKIFYCGKESGCHYKTQEEINRMLVCFAREGYTVGRIKGGDPFVFGRGGEEAVYLRQNGIDFEVIPGISSAVAVPCYGGIPVTHRSISRSFHVFTGKTGDEWDYDWEVVSKLDGTLIFLMGMENLEGIVKNLLERGMNKEKPCAVISNGASSNQRVVTGRLCDIRERAKKMGMKPPAVVVIGEVVKLREILNWYEEKPLFGKKICITRPRERALEFKERLQDLGADVVEVNSIKIKDTSENLGEVIKLLEDFDYIIFTSANGVRIFFDYLRKVKYDLRRIKAGFAVIGEKTKEELEERGIIPDIVPGEYVAESLYEALKPHLHPGQKILLPRAKNSRSFLKDALSKTGAEVFEVEIYEAVPGEDFRDDILDADYFTFASPSAVKSFVEMYGSNILNGKKVVAIGPVTAAELEKCGVNAVKADKYTACGMVEKILMMEGNYVCKDEKAKTK